jgi:hypothetical protein
MKKLEESIEAKESEETENRRFFWSGSGKDRRARMGNTRGKKVYLGVDTTVLVAFLFARQISGYT